MKKTILWVAAALVAAGCLAFAQTTPQSSSDRKVVVRVAPTYPDLAKKMHIHGVVRVEAMVRPNGSVKSTRVLGGNPVLVGAAQDAISKWKFESAPSETTEVLQLTFDND